MSAASSERWPLAQIVNSGWSCRCASSAMRACECGARNADGAVRHAAGAFVVFAHVDQQRAVALALDAPAAA